jgi:peptide/nickel transport system substrate-binding protein
VDTSFNDLSYTRLAIRYPARVHPGYKVFTSFVFLNTRQPPFSSVKARQAVSYAIDRTRIIQLLGSGAGQGTVTCQLLPADFPGYQPYCPYTTPPHDGAWHGPDLATGRRLARESGTTNVPVTVWNVNGLGNRNVSSYLEQLLRQLGYRATLRNISPTKFSKAVLSPHAVQLGIAGFGADIPTMSNYFVPFLSCRSLHQASGANPSWYCNPHPDQLASQAQGLQVTDPAAARRAWAQLYRLVSNQALVVPIFTGSITVFVSARAANYQEQPIYGPLLDQIWVK